MNRLIENGSIIEMVCGSNFAFNVNDNTAFLPTEYKVLQSQGNNCFVKCMKMHFNGKVQLYYLTKAYKSFDSLVHKLNEDSFMTIIANLFANIIEVKNNGFLSCCNIDTSFEKIYIDPATLKVSLVYIPLKIRIYDDYPTFENELRVNLIRLISIIPEFSSDKMVQLTSLLSDGTLTIEDLLYKLKGGKGCVKGQECQQKKTLTKTAGQMSIIAMNAPMRIEIAITKDEFVIGKKESVVDGVISFNKMISRIHCKINKSGNQYTITDLQSANGTYVNKRKMNPHQPYPINNGDIIRLANSDFQVSIN
ncbi:MAG: FHA domain-containing protein [Acutalibacteraceae bacterium]|nr:FHA domain-containing protein [Acutalibacteraceae bacterium]